MNNNTKSEYNNYHLLPSFSITNIFGNIYNSMFPPSINDMAESVELSEHIINSVVRSVNYSSKFCNYCELSNIFYDKYNKDILLGILKGAEHINCHHCYGRVQYHKNNENLFKEANMYFECYKNIIQNYVWTNKNIKILRSNGEIFDSIIIKGSPIMFNNDNLMIYVEFFENDIQLNKWVYLNDTIITEKEDDVFINNKTIRGILTLNPELKNEQLVLTINNHPEWLNEYRKKWIKLFTDQINKMDVNYKFEYED